MKIVSTQVHAVDVNRLISTLNVALSEEWLAYYQYWVGARVMEGPMRSEIETEFLKHAQEELSHAEKLIKRIIELGGTPVLDPADWQTLAQCKYEAPADGYVESILEQNLVSERCAIKRYRAIADYTHGVDYTTTQMAIDILAEEIDHETDIRAYIKDISAMKQTMGKMMK